VRWVRMWEGLGGSAVVIGVVCGCTMLSVLGLSVEVLMRVATR